MIPAEGKLLLGLDEFMLRFGHVKVLVNTASEMRGSWHRLNKRVSAQLTEPVPIPCEMMRPVAEYLAAKKLCRVGRDGEPPKSGHRYPELYVDLSEPDKLCLARVDPSDRDPPMVWWQDRCLADPAVVSKVGGIGVSARSGSKTGLSHVSDWAQLLGMIEAAW